MGKKLISLLLVVILAASVMSVAVISGSAASGETWYVKGTFNNWEKNDDYIMSDEGDGIYKLADVELEEGAEFKVNLNGDWSQANHPGSNYKVAEAGTYTIVFDSNTNEVSLEGVAPDYYLIGSFNNWTANDAEYKLTLNESSDTEEYMIEGVKLTVDTQFKAFSNGKYYPDGYGNNYGENGEITADGYYDIYFRPNADGGDDWFYNCIYVAKSDRFTGYTISLKDEIAVNFYAKILEDDFTAEYSYGNDDYSRSGEADITYLDNDIFKITCMVNARSMTDEVALTVKSGDSVILTGSYRVVDYCAAVAADEDLSADASLINLLCATLDYGAAVQSYFGYKTDDLANSADYIGKVNADWKSPAVPAIVELGLTNMDDDRYLGSAMAVTGQTAIRLFFDTSDGQPTATIGTDDAEWHDSKQDGVSYIEIGGISAKDIFDSYSVYIDGMKYTYNASGYYNYIMASTDAKYEAVQEVMGTMYNYYEYAKAYKN